MVGHGLVYRRVIDPGETKSMSDKRCTLGVTGVPASFVDAVDATHEGSGARSDGLNRGAAFSLHIRLKIAEISR